MIFPTIDLRPLVVTGVAVSVFGAWIFAGAFADSLRLGDSFLEIMSEQTWLAIDWIVRTAGTVIVALGCAFLLQRKSSRARPFLLTATSVVIVALILFVDLTSLGLEWLRAERRHYELSPLGTPYAVVVEILRETTLLVAVAVASRLYFVLRRASPDVRDGRRFMVLAAFSLALTSLSVFQFTIVMLPVLPSVPVAVLWLIQHFASRLVDSTGTVFLFGFIAIASLRKSHTESNLAWVTTASVSVALAYWPLRYGVIVIPGDSWSDLLMQALPALVVGVIGGPIYLLAIDRDALRRTIATMRWSFANLPTLIRRLRSWPDRLPEEE